MNKPKHDIFCICKECEEYLESIELSVTIGLDIKEILNNE